MPLTGVINYVFLHLFIDKVEDDVRSRPIAGF